MTKNITELAKEILTIEADSINKMRDKLDYKFEQAIDILYACKGRVIVTGMGKSGQIGKKIAATLSSTGTPSYFLHPAESTHGDSGIITRDDVIISLSNSGETQELLNLLPLIKRFNVPMIALTGGLNSALAKASEVTLDVSVEKEACTLNKAPTASTTAALAMGDALAICLLEKRGFSEEDFLIFHPSGALGKGILYNVEELMITGDKLPIVTENADFNEVIELISEKKLGMAIITNKNGQMTGVLTDGDIRRTILKLHKLEGIKVKNIMTKTPKFVTPEMLAAKALYIMEKYSITALAVADDNLKPVGVLHIHEILKSGIA